MDPEDLTPLERQLLEAVQLWDAFFDEMPKGQFGKITCDVGIMNRAFISTAKSLHMAKEKLGELPPRPSMAS